MYVAVDVGTSGIKTVAFDRNGEERLVARRAVAIERRRPAWAEQDMDACWASVCETIREAAAAAGPVEFLAIAAQGDGCWLVDGEGRPVRPAILWNDGRAAAYVDEWLRDGTMQRGFARNGSISFPGLSNAIMRWLADHEPDALARSRFAVSCGSWIFFKLTGRTLIEPSDASAPFLDLETGAYSDALLDLYGLAACRDKLPPVGGGGELLGALSEAAAAETGLPAGTPTVLAPYDVASATLGAGARHVGDAVLVLGTTFLCGVITDRPVLAGEPSGATVSLGLPGLFLRFFPTLAGTEVLEWAAGLLGRSGAPGLVELAMTGRPGAGGLHFLPYLSPAGERAPFLDPSARGSLWNLTLEHGAADIARAIVEGLTMVLRDCLEAAASRPSRLFLSGGGSNNAGWRQLIADVTGLEVRRAPVSEVTARGAALAGLLVTGRATLEETGSLWMEGGETAMPDRARAAFYERQYAEFRRLRALAKEGWNGGRRETGGNT